MYQLFEKGLKDYEVEINIVKIMRQVRFNKAVIAQIIKEGILEKKMDKHMFDNKSIHLTSLRRSISRRSSSLMESDDSVDLSDDDDSAPHNKDLKLA